MNARCSLTHQVIEDSMRTWQRPVSGVNFVQITCNFHENFYHRSQPNGRLASLYWELEWLWAKTKVFLCSSGSPMLIEDTRWLMFEHDCLSRVEPIETMGKPYFDIQSDQRTKSADTIRAAPTTPGSASLSLFCTLTVILFMSSASWFDSTRKAKRAFRRTCGLWVHWLQDIVKQWTNVLKWNTYWRVMW